ncbi:hypothetical protein Tco_0534371 [Tanacetum coccineum]
MVVLESCPKHNMVTYLEKTNGNAEFHEIIDFLARSSIHNALTATITAKVAGKPVSISEASIRSDLLFDDADGIDSLPNQAIFDAIQLMGYEGDLTLMNVPVPLDHFPVNALTSKVFSFMVKKGKHFSGKVTPLFSHMLVQPPEDEDEQLERPSEPQPTPSPTHPRFLVGIKEGSQPIKILQDMSGAMDTPISVYDLLSLCIKSLDEKCIIEVKIGRQEVLKETMDAKGIYMESEGAQDVGRTRNVMSEEKETADNVVSTEDAVSTEDVISTDKVKVSTDRSRDSTDKEKDSTDRPNEVLLNMSQAKAVSREKEKGIELKDVETERPRPTSTRSLLTLKPLPKIDPKDKGKKKIKEEDESDTKSEGIPEAEKKMAKKVQEDWEAEEDVKKLAEEEATKAALSNEYDFIQARIEADRLLALRLQDEERER